jgi:hypothetical protein
MEKTDKSAEEIPIEARERIEREAHNYARQWEENEYMSARLGYERGATSEQNLVQQQLSEYKEVIKELLPLATSSKLTVDDHNWRELWENKTKTIDRAKALAKE